MIQLLHRHFNVEIVEIHDDWGTQRGTMFSVNTLREMILPYLKKVVDAAHEEGVFVELHSCGKIDDFVPEFIGAGVDTWRGQAIVDKAALVEQFSDRFKFGVEVRPAALLPDEEAKAFADQVFQQYHDKNVWVILSRTLSAAQQKSLYNTIREIGKI